MPKTDSVFSPARSDEGREARGTSRGRATAFCSDVGGRAEQQDNGNIWKNPRTGAILIVVCDGVGGSRSGGEASAIVVQTAEQLWRDRGELLTDPQRDLLSLSRVAHERITDVAQEGEKRAPASTVAALYVTPTQAHWIHSGDSRIYRFQNSRLVSRTRDHSVVQILVEQGEVRERDMGSHPDQGRLLQSLGVQEYRPPTYATAAIDETDGFLLCTDGFWERTPPALMAAVLATDPSHLEPQLRKAVRRAVRANGPKGDNVTAAVAAPLRPPTGLARHPGRPFWLIAFGLVVLAAAVGGAWWKSNRIGLAPAAVGNHPGPTVPLDAHPSPAPVTHPENPVPAASLSPSAPATGPNTLDQSSPAPSPETPAKSTGASTTISKEIIGSATLGQNPFLADTLKYWQVKVGDNNFIYIADQEVTEWAWQQIFGNTPNLSGDQQMPVTNVSADEAVDFANKWNEGHKPKLNDQPLNGWRYRLPTAEEWYAAAATASFLPKVPNLQTALHHVVQPQTGNNVFELFDNVSEIVREGNGTFVAVGPNFDNVKQAFTNGIVKGKPEQVVAAIKKLDHPLIPSKTVGLRLVLARDEPSTASRTSAPAPQVGASPGPEPAAGSSPSPVPIPAAVAPSPVPSSAPDSNVPDKHKDS